MKGCGFGVYLGFRAQGFRLGVRVEGFVLQLQGSFSLGLGLLRFSQCLGFEH